jgi:hypothetical protein
MVLTLRTKGTNALLFLSVIFTLAAILGPVLSLTAPVKLYADTSVPMSITIEGLKQGDAAKLLIGLDTAELEIKNAFFEYSITGIGSSLTKEIAPVLEDGVYLLLLDVSSQYYREPKGYIFSVRNSAFINSNGRAIIFDLKPKPSYSVLERVIDLSAPPKQPIPLINPPFWQRILEPAAIVFAVIAAVLMAFIVWRQRSKRVRD